MGLVKCKKCGHQISDRAFRCPKCGCSVEKAKAELVNSERQVPYANPLFPKKQEGINHVVAEEKNKGNLAPKPKMSETSKDEKYFSIAVIVCVLMVGLIILGFIGRCSTKREVPKGGSVEKITEEIGKDASKSALSAESRANNNDISWLYGIWECTTEYGKLQIEISESTITYKDGFDTERCSYRIDGNVLRMQGASYTTTFSLDFKERRIDMGEGHWMHKVESSDFSPRQHVSSSYSFQSAQDVISYLSSHNFCNGNNCITFQDMCLYTNGVCATGAINIVGYNESQAVVEAYSPLLGGNVRFKVDNRNGRLIDLNTGDMYN